MMPSSEVTQILEAEDFVLDKQSNLGHMFSRTVPNGWRIVAYGGHAGNIFLGTSDPSKIDELSITLDSKGTRHYCNSIASLKRNLPVIVRALTEVSETPELLKCPKCKTRYVHAKEPTAGQKWRPFLSCEGMMIVGSGKNKGVLCDGVSKALPAVIYHS